MGTAARKARKRAGIKIEPKFKVGTPIEQRVLPQVFRTDHRLPSYSLKLVKKREAQLRVLAEAKARESENA